MLSVPTVGQMLSVIGVALLAVVVLVSAVTLLLDHLTRRTADAVNNTAALDAQAAPQPAATVPGQRSTATLSVTH